MTQLKETMTIRLDGSRSLVQSDGVQKREYVFRAGNNSDEADGVIWTDRWTPDVQCSIEGGALLYETTLKGHSTKGRLFTRFRRAILNT